MDAIQQAITLLAPQKDNITLRDFKVQKLSKYLPKVMPAHLAIKTDELLTQLELEGFQTTADLAFLPPQWIDTAKFPALLLGKPYESVVLWACLLVRS